MKTTLISGVATLFLTLSGWLVSAHADAITVYSTRTQLDTAAPGLVIEDFEEAVSYFSGLTNTFTIMGNPLDKDTSNQVFSPGDIADGLRITANTLSGLIIPNIGVLAPGYRNNPTHAISAYYSDTTAPQLTISFFNGGVSAFGLDLYGSKPTSDVTVNVFSGLSNLGTFQLNDIGNGTFFGGMSQDLITSVTFTSNFGFDFVSIDNVAFGSPRSTTVPDTGATLGLFLAALSALVVAKSRQSSLR